MVIGDFDAVGAAIPPDEADPPLIVDADAVLAGTIAFQGFQPIAGRGLQVQEVRRRVNHVQFTQGNLGDSGKPPGSAIPIKAFGVFILEASDHEGMIYRDARNAKRYMSNFKVTVTAYKKYPAAN